MVGPRGREKKKKKNLRINFNFFFFFWSSPSWEKSYQLQRLSPLFLYSFLLVETALFYSLNISIIFQFYYCFKFQIPQVVFRAPFSFRFVPYYHCLKELSINIFRCLNACTGPCCWAFQDNDGRVSPTRIYGCFTRWIYLLLLLNCLGKKKREKRKKEELLVLLDRCST